MLKSSSTSVAKLQMVGLQLSWSSWRVEARSRGCSLLCLLCSGIKRASWRKLQVCLRDAGRARARKGEAQELLNGNNLKPIKTNLHIQ